MGSLDAFKDEFVSQLLEGNWKKLFPTKIFSNLNEWFTRHKDKKAVAIRFIFFNESSNKDIDTRYAVYLLCSPKPKKGKVDVFDLKFAPETLPLAIPPMLYDKPLYNMPNDVLNKILKKKKKK